MNRYDIVLLRSEKDDFLGRLQDLGLVDVTVAGWEPDESERELVASIEKHGVAVARLKAMAKSPDFKGGKPYRTGDEAWTHYLKASAAEDAVNARIANAEKEAREAKVWGDFNAADLAELDRGGVSLRYFGCYTKEFETFRGQWEQEYNLVPIAETEGMTYFVVVSEHGDQVTLNAQELKAPTANHRQYETEIKHLYKEREQWTEILERVASSLELVAAHADGEKERLQFSQVVRTGREEAEGSLVVLEGWATCATSDKVDALLDAHPGLVYFKSTPTPEDEAPVLLKNNKFSSLFELIGSFYSLPRYGTMDLTPFFGPFYMLFFGLCLADAGYGLLFVIAGAFMLRKLSPEMKGIARLVILCGLSTVVCGLLMGSFFGIPYAEYGPFIRFRDYILSTDNMFMLSLAIGVIQILFGMLLKVVSYTRRFGFRYALSTIGWMAVIISTLLAVMLPSMGVEGFGMSSTPYLICLGAGLFLMLFMNSPGKNPFVNFGKGLWNTYNDITGILSDVLSYIRLFAIGLSGGILALVFNQLALGLSPDIPVVRQICIVLILLIGHGINLFMSTLSSFVHPMRLTFVEFYKNAGFETSNREFAPFKRKR